MPILHPELSINKTVGFYYAHTKSYIVRPPPPPFDFGLVDVSRVWCPGLHSGRPLASLSTQTLPIVATSTRPESMGSSHNRSRIYLYEIRHVVIIDLH